MLFSSTTNQASSSRDSNTIYPYCIYWNNGQYQWPSGIYGYRQVCSTCDEATANCSFFSSAGACSRSPYQAGQGAVLTSCSHARNNVHLVWIAFLLFYVASSRDCSNQLCQGVQFRLFLPALWFLSVPSLRLPQLISSVRCGCTSFRWNCATNPIGQQLVTFSQVSGRDSALAMRPPSSHSVRHRRICAPLWYILQSLMPTCRLKSPPVGLWVLSLPLLFLNCTSAVLE